ncbi:MAG: LPS assembly lipoprotein LptE [Hyphomicrobiaceae bacterium]
MSLPEAHRYSSLPGGRTIKRFAGIAALISIGFAVTSCGSDGFKPMYAASLNGGTLSNEMAAVSVTTIPGRVGQRIRNELVFQTTGGGHEKAPKYSLDVTLTERVTSTLVNLEGDSASQIYSLDASFSLVDKQSKKVLFRGKSYGRAGFERFGSIFANVRAREDAEDRAARTVARDLKIQLEGYLARRT